MSISAGCRRSGSASLALALTFGSTSWRSGDETATGLGLNVRWQRLLLLALAALLASVATAVVGVMGFIGLMAPYPRRLVGGDHHIMLPIATLVCMLLVVLSDAVGRAIAPPIEVSAGILAPSSAAVLHLHHATTTASSKINEPSPMSIGGNPGHHQLWP